MGEGVVGWSHFVVVVAFLERERYEPLKPIPVPESTCMLQRQSTPSSPTSTFPTCFFVYFDATHVYPTVARASPSIRKYTTMLHITTLTHSFFQSLTHSLTPNPIQSNPIPSHPNQSNPIRDHQSFLYVCFFTHTHSLYIHESRHLHPRISFPRICLKTLTSEDFPSLNLSFSFSLDLFFPLSHTPNNHTRPLPSFLHLA